MEHQKYNESVWIKKSVYEDAETKFYENLAKASITPLASEVAKARQLLIESRDSFKDGPLTSAPSVDPGAIKFFEKKILDFEKVINSVMEKIQQLELRVSLVEGSAKSAPLQQVHSISVSKQDTKKVANDNDDEDVDLFGSDSDEEENDAAAKVREERLAAYNAKKSKKPVLIAKSNVILDVKPWDDETDMKLMEKLVREITADGLLWGAAKLVPLAYGIQKLQISCVVEDDKISIDWLQEEITNLEEFVQSVDIAAFNKI